MSLATAGIHCAISQRLSGAMEDCVQQPRMLSPKVLLCNDAYLAHCGTQPRAQEHRRQDGSRRPGTMAKCQTTTGHLEVDTLVHW